MFALDRFIDEDVMVNTIVAENQRVLGELPARVAERELSRTSLRGPDRRGLRSWPSAGIPRHGLFWDLAGLDAPLLRINTITRLVALLLPDLDAAIAGWLVAQLEDRATHAAPWPVPSVPGAEPRSGPVRRPPPLERRDVGQQQLRPLPGLLRHGWPHLGPRIEDATAKLIERWEFREYSDALTAEGHGAPDFS